jgi:hypothetical protein
MEKAILRVVEEGKGTQQPLLEQVPEAVLNGLTDGQKKATTLVLGTTDQFIGIQGYAGVGKTTQLKAVISALETLPADVRPVMTGLAPTHQAVKEMSDVGVGRRPSNPLSLSMTRRRPQAGSLTIKDRCFLSMSPQWQATRIRRHCSRPLPAAAVAQSRWGISTSLKRSTWARRLS